MAKAIARIYEGDTDRAVGVGFWVFPGYLLTCAHVVNQALGWKDDAKEVPEGFIMLDFPDLQPRQRLKGRVVHWLPIIKSNSEGDIAVLEVEVAAMKPMSLGLPTEQPLSVSGFPEGYDTVRMLDTVKIAPGADLDQGLVQLDTLTGRIQKGFSGSPVWEVLSGTVVGMVTLSDQDSGAGWMVPAQILSQQLSETVLSNIARFIQIEGVSDRCITDLLNILKIDSYRFGLIWKIAKGVLPGNVEENRVDAIQAFQEQHLDTNFFKAFKLLQLFSDDYPNFFADFAVALEHIEVSDPWIGNFQQELTRWKQHYFPTQAVISNTQVSAYLMILVEPEEQGSTRASASLRYLQADGTQKNISINLDQNAIEPGSACSIAELPALMDQLIRNTTKVLDRPETSNYTLIVELFLPVDFLCEPVDRWTVKDDFGDSVRLGTNYRVVVRSYDRLEKPGLRASLAQSWNRMKLWLEQMDDPNSIAAQIYHAEEIDCSRLNSFSEALKKQLGVKVTCPLPVSAGQRVKILKGILASGVPVAFWMRCSECVRADATVGIDDFLTVGLLRSPPDLLEQVRSQRAIAWDTHGTPEGRWARHLTVLWDDFDRIPSQLDAFREGASRK